MSAELLTTPEHQRSLTRIRVGEAIAELTSHLRLVPELPEDDTTDEIDATVYPNSVIERADELFAAGDTASVEAAHTMLDMYKSLPPETTGLTPAAS